MVGGILDRRDRLLRAELDELRLEPALAGVELDDEDAAGIESAARRCRIVRPFGIGGEIGRRRAGAGILVDTVDLAGDIAPRQQRRGSRVPFGIGEAARRPPARRQSRRQRRRRRRALRSLMAGARLWTRTSVQLCLHVGDRLLDQGRAGLALGLGREDALRPPRSRRRPRAPALPGPPAPRPGRSSARPSWCGSAT